MIMLVRTCLGLLAVLASFAFPSTGALADPVRRPVDALILAQNQPAPSPPQSEEEKAKEHKKGPPEKSRLRRACLPANLPWRSNYLEA